MLLWNTPPGESTEWTVEQETYPRWKDDAMQWNHINLTVERRS